MNNRLLTAVGKLDNFLLSAVGKLDNSIVRNKTNFHAAQIQFWALNVGVYSSSQVEYYILH